MIQRPESLDITPEKHIFFSPHDFYSSLKDSVISNKEYEAVKKFYKLRNLDNLGHVSKLLKFQEP